MIRNKKQLYNFLKSHTLKIWEWEQHKNFAKCETIKELIEFVNFKIFLNGGTSEEEFYFKWVLEKICNIFFEAQNFKDFFKHLKNSVKDYDLKFLHSQWLDERGY